MLDYLRKSLIVSVALLVGVVLFIFIDLNLLPQPTAVMIQDAFVFGLLLTGAVNFIAGLIVMLRYKKHDKKTRIWASVAIAVSLLNYAASMAIMNA